MKMLQKCCGKLNKRAKKNVKAEEIFGKKPKGTNATLPKRWAWLYFFVGGGFVIYERKSEILKQDKAAKVSYYVKKQYSMEFGCDMYNVGIRMDGECREINDFSPDEGEAIGLCDYLYEENATLKNLFSRSEEFIVTR